MRQQLYTRTERQLCSLNVNFNLCGKEIVSQNSTTPQVDNVISDEEHEETTNFIDPDSKHENSVVSVKEVDNIGISFKTLENINARTGKIKCWRATIRAKGALFSATIDQGSPASFVNKKTADMLLSKNPRAKILTIQERPITTSYVHYNHRSLFLFGKLLIDINSNG